MNKSIVVLSGGLDSATILWEVARKAQQTLGARTYALTVDYGQRHRKEIEAACALIAELARLNILVEHRIVDLSAIKTLLAGSSQTSDDVPVPYGHYSEETMAKTVVPNRNMILLAIAGGWAASIEASAIYFGAHNGDHAIYPDCRPDFIGKLNAALASATEAELAVIAPYASALKEDIVKRGVEIGVPYHLTWSCYEGGKVHCGKCGTCVERREAFINASAIDPTLYACTWGETLRVMGDVD